MGDYILDSPCDSLLGSEWKAFALHGKPGLVMVWRPIGESNINEALRTCTTCRQFGNWIFGISVRTK